MSICVIWDLMLDKFSYGRVKRLNPESPAPLITVEKEEYKLGGAANVAANIASLDGRSDLIGCLGSSFEWELDNNGNVFKDICFHNNIALYVIGTSHPTITKQRFIEQTYHQQMLRADYEEKISLSDKEKDQVIKFLIQTESQYVIISDYLKWTIDFDLVNKIKTYCHENNIKILVDTKPKNVNFFKWVYLLKPNFKEFCEMIGQQISNDDIIIEHYWKQLVKDLDVNLVVTRWEYWATLISKEWIVNHLHTEAKQVFDVTWAWDTFIAAICLWLFKWFDLVESVKLGNKASGVVVWKVWTQTVSWEELKG